MYFKVVAKRYGDSVKFAVEADDTKSGLLAAKAEANNIFGYRTGEAGAPAVAVEPIADPVDKEG